MQAYRDIKKFNKPLTAQLQPAIPIASIDSLLEAT